jgi:hypothetical protein
MLSVMVIDLVYYNFSCKELEAQEGGKPGLPTWR